MESDVMKMYGAYIHPKSIECYFTVEEALALDGWYVCKVFWYTMSKRPIGYDTVWVPKGHKWREYDRSL